MRSHALLVLKLLVERSPEVIGRDEILASVWGHDALSESALAQVIKEIRLALGDSAKTPSHVVTKYGRGYQFIAKVDIVDDDASELAPNRSRWKVPVALAALLLIGALGLWYLQSPSPPPEDSVAASGPRWLIRGVETDSGESLSEPFARYLGMVLGSAIGGERVGVSAGDEVVPGVRYLDVSLGVRDDQPLSPFDLRLGEGGTDNPLMQQAYGELDQLVSESLDRVLKDILIEPEVKIESGVVSQSAFATETLLRGMAAQFAGELDRAVALFEACLAEDPNFDFARYELAISLRRQGEYQRALGLLASLEGKRTSSFWIRRIQNARGISLWRLGRLDEAADAYQLALSVVETGVTRGIISTNLAILNRDLSRYQEAESSALEAIDIAREHDHRSLEASALNTLASIYMDTGRLDETLQPLELARELYYEAGHRSSYASVLSRTGKVRERLGELDTATQMFRLAIPVREQLGNELDEANSRVDLSRVARIQGDFDEARAQARRALEIATQAGDQEMIRQGNASLAQLALAEQRYEDAMVYAAEALRWAELRDEQDDLLESRLDVLTIELANGQAPFDAAGRLE